ncbi:hypothetical protein BB561_005707 [Smittium simulii]|uniref:chitin synthase n=1 Tax=Smittium simulii TaxID=133385 RepID=A0A2T9Y8W6_9FUNG|nr:hypothetical protein BB561_005707 [Smittium simulii]
MNFNQNQQNTNQFIAQDPQNAYVYQQPLHNQGTMNRSNHLSNSQNTIAGNQLGYDFNNLNNSQNVFNEKIDGKNEQTDEKMVENEEEIEQTITRSLWVKYTWLMTWLVPSFVLRRCGMARDDIIFAWREKVALCISIVYTWFLLLFLIVGLGLLLCPRQQVWTSEEVANHSDSKDAFISMRGVVYEITYFMNQVHGLGMNGAPKDQMLTYAGYEVNSSFPIDVRTACPDLMGGNTDTINSMYLSTENTDDVSLGWYNHKVGSLASSEEVMNPLFYYNYVLPKMKSFKKGNLVWEMKRIENYHKEQGLAWRVIDGEVFNLNDYFYTSKLPQNQAVKKWKFLDSEIETIFDDGGARSTDITEYWKNMRLSEAEKKRNYNCMKQLFYVGKIDTRRSVQCLFTNYMLFGFALALVFVVLVKFAASLQFGTKKKPLPVNKFVICQVPCYTEGEDSIERTLNSLTVLDYNDERRLLFVICDGNIVGSGNDKSTPRIVLDTLGVDPEYDPPAREYFAIAEGSKQYNRAKVYSGLYDQEGHVVPFMVVVKVGNPFEKTKPGNRGKRDSQILLMAFLNKVHFDLPMSPLELEMYHHMHHIIGIPPNLFDFLLQVDADTLVEPDSLIRLVSACTSDSKIAGICGETRISNEQKSWITMMQVYEYFISHHMAKAFESIFGAVTCLPGCFCMYRLTSQQGKPLLIATSVVDAYAERHVDTLHKKNLLSLGEDRYLTTLMLKHFPDFNLKFIRDAKCDTIVPEKWSVLMSQRRRWINSTVHNLFELILIEDLCGFCCFSMRFVVFLDLFGTLTMPTVLIYMCYLVFIAVSKVADVGYISLIILGAVYGLQAIIFILRREWQHVGWMVIYLMCFPLWSFVLPIYSFWHFDDFSWGNTRTVIGEGKRKVITENDFEFDPKSIPLVHWRDYEMQLKAVGQLNEPPPNMNPNAMENGLNGGIQRPHTRVGSAMSFNIRSLSNTPIPGAIGVYDTMGVAPGGEYFTNNPSIPGLNSMHMSFPTISYPSPVVYSSQENMPLPQHLAPMDNNYATAPIDTMRSLNVSEHLMAYPIYPTEDQIVQAISYILSTSDMSTISKKTVRDQLSAEFNCDMSAYKEFISETIDFILSGNR